MHSGLTVNRAVLGRTIENAHDSVVTGRQFHNGGRVLVRIGASVPLEGLARSAIELMMFHMAHVSWNDACAVFYSLCTSTSILGRRRLVEFVLGCTRRHDRDESKIVAFHVKIIIFGRDSRILSFW